MTVQSTERDQIPSPFVEPWQPTPRVVIATVVAVTLVVLLSITTFAAQRIWYTPEAALTGYFDALKNRDADKASSYLRSDSADSATIAGVIEPKSFVPPTGLKIEDIEADSDDDDGKNRKAKVSYTIGDSKQTAEISLRRSDELTLGLFRSWQLSENRPELLITTTLPTPVRVNGVSLATNSEESPRAKVFPGRYVVDIAENPLLESDPLTVDVGFGDANAELVTRIKATAQTEVDKQVKAYLTGCLVTATKPESNCPFSNSYSSITNPVWRIDTFPTIELKLGSTGQYVVESTTDGQAILTGTGYGGTPYADKTSFDIEGVVSVNGDKLVFTPPE